jgi:hypothetical protein
MIASILTLLIAGPAFSIAPCRAKNWRSLAIIKGVRAVPLIAFLWAHETGLLSASCTESQPCEDGVLPLARIFGEAATFGLCVGTIVSAAGLYLRKSAPTERKTEMAISLVATLTLITIILLRL